MTSYSTVPNQLDNKSRMKSLSTIPIENIDLEIDKVSQYCSMASWQLHARKVRAIQI